MPELKPQGPPSEPLTKTVWFEGREVKAETFMVREYGGNQQYIMVRYPNARPFTRISVFKSGLQPIADQSTDIPSWVRSWFR